MIWGFTIWIVLSVIVSSAAALIYAAKTKHLKGESVLVVFLLCAGILIYLGYYNYQSQRKELANCNNDVNFNTAVWAGNENTGYRLCHEQYSFWHLTN